MEKSDINLFLAKIGQTHDYLVARPNARIHDGHQNLRHFYTQQTHIAHNRQWCQRPEQFAYSLPPSTEPLPSNDSVSHYLYSQVNAHLSCHSSHPDTPCSDIPASLSESFNNPVSGSVAYLDATPRTSDNNILRLERPYHIPSQSDDARPEEVAQGIRALSPPRMLYPPSETQSSLAPCTRCGAQSRIPYQRYPARTYQNTLGGGAGPPPSSIWLDPYDVAPRGSQLNYSPYDATQYTLPCIPLDYLGRNLVLPPQRQVWPSIPTSSALEGSSTPLDLFSSPTASPQEADARAAFASGGTPEQVPQSPAATTPNSKSTCPLCGTSAIKLIRHMKICKKNPDKVSVQCKRCGAYLRRSDNMKRHQTTSKCKIAEEKKLAKVEGCRSPPPYSDSI